MGKNINKEVGILNQRVIELLDLHNEFDECSILMGDQNIEHMKETHSDDYKKYGKKIKEILKKPTYVSKHPNDGSIHYIKVIDGDYVKVVVRPTKRKILFVRTIFVISEYNIRKYWKSNAFKSY